jgi:uncharacterized membrane protein
MESPSNVDSRLSALIDRVDMIEEAINHLIRDSEERDRIANERVNTQPRAVIPPPPVRSAPSLKTSPSLRTPPPAASPTNWLGLVSVLCFVFAAVFIVKLAIDSGWLTPVRQMAISALFGFSLTGAGLALIKTNRGYASLLPGAGIIALYMTVIASHNLYALIGVEAAVALAALVSAICLWLYTVFNHEVYPVTAVLGVYFAPFLLGSTAQSEFTVFYHLLSTGAFAIIAVWLRTRLLTVIGAYCAIMTTVLLRAKGLDLALLSMAMFVHFVIYAVAVVVHSTQFKSPLSLAEAWGYFPVLLIFYVGEYSLISALNASAAPWVSLGFAVFLIGLYLVSRRVLTGRSLESSSVIVAFASIVFFHSLYLELLPENVKAWLLPLFVAALSLVPAVIDTKKIAPEKIIPMLAIGAVIVIEYLGVAFDLLNTQKPFDGLPLVFVSVVSLLFFYFKKGDHLTQTDKSAATAILGSAHALAILALYRLLAPAGSLAVSASWLLYAALIMAAGFKLEDRSLTRSALAVLGLAAIKALLYDAASAPTVVRITCLLLTGVVLYGCGFLLKRTENWRTPAGRPAGE